VALIFSHGQITSVHYLCQKKTVYVFFHGILCWLNRKFCWWFNPHLLLFTPHVWCKNTMCVDSTSFLLMEKHLVTGTTMPSCFYISVGAKTAHKQNSDAHSREIIDLCNPGFWFPAVGTHVRLFRHTSSSKKQGEARWSLVRMCDCFFFCDLKDIPGHRMSRIPATRSADECFLQSELDTKFCPHHRKQG
jgi:hypothetical protein